MQDAMHDLQFPIAPPSHSWTHATPDISPIHAINIKTWTRNGSRSTLPSL
jgi:hypothetical protein